MIETEQEKLMRYMKRTMNADEVRSMLLDHLEFELIGLDKAMKKKAADKFIEGTHGTREELNDAWMGR